MASALWQSPSMDEHDEERYSRRRLIGGVLGRTWLWFVAGCLAITLVPMLFGWRPYVIESGSMQPRIKVGDVVIASPNHDAQQLLGHVATFEDPEFPGKIKTHRVIRVTPEGTLVTKGDANQTPDSQPVNVAKVRGMGRLLVRYAGLPVVWAHTGQWVYLLLFGASLYLAGLAVARDRETEDDHRESSDSGNEPPSDPPAERIDDAAAQIPRPREPRPAPVLGVEREALRRATRRLAWRSATLVGLSVILALPTARAAFASVTRNTGNAWAIPNYDYTTEAKALSPFVYYKLDESSGTAATDSSGNGRTGTYTATNQFTYQVNGAFVTDTPNTGVTQTSASSCIYTSTTASIAAPGPATYSEIVWFKAAANYNQGGKLVGFERQRTGVSDSNNGGQYDRHIYMDGNGRLWFGVWLTTAGTAKTISTAAGSDYADGGWHMAAATMGVGGMKLYVDGVLQASDPNTTSETFQGAGYWRFGCGNLSGWGSPNWSGPNAPSAQANRAFLGSLDEVAIYHSLLTPTQIAFLYWIR